MDETSNVPTKVRAQRSDRWQLLAFWEGGNLSFELRGEASLILGRGDDCDVAVPHESVSRRHARLTEDSGVWRIEDLGSSNGTFVAGARIGKGEARDVSPGTVVMLGDARVLLDAPTLGPSTATPARRAEGAMDRVERLVDVVADSVLSVLLLGETGVGKGRLAEEIHARSSRRKAPLVRLNCAAVPEALLESELFGHERGAFTGAVKSKAGLLEAAHGGTMFLDEIAEIPKAVQAKLLHVLEHGEVTRVGAVVPLRIDVRFIAATHQSVVADGHLRRDLYFRLAGVPIRIPPLRERRDEIADIARSLVEDASRGSGRTPPRVSSAAQTALEAYSWPGNVRELRNVMARAALLCGGSDVLPEHLIFDSEGFDSVAGDRPGLGATLVPPPKDATESLSSGRREYEKQHIMDVLDLVGGHQGKAAERLGISRRTLTNRLTELGLPRPRKGKREEP